MLFSLLTFSVAILVWTYAGYPLALRWAAGHYSKKAPDTPIEDPRPVAVSIVMAVRNEGSRMDRKLKNLLAASQNHEAEILVICDHCNDDTAKIASASHPERVRVIDHQTGNPGKAGAINAGLAAATKPLILFADVRQDLAPDAIAILAQSFADPQVGAVSGALAIQSSKTGAAQGLDSYWALEKKIRLWEAQIDSSIGCTGAIYMIRRELFQPIPIDTILDDVLIPMQIATQGFRIGFEPGAVAFDPQPLQGAAESRRKIRTLAGNFQLLSRYPGWLLPLKNRLWWQLISHKYLRVLSPPFLASTLICTLLLREHPLIASALALQVILWLLGLLGLALPQLKSKLISIPAAFAFLQLSVIRGFLFWVTRPRGTGGSWK